MYTNEEGVSKCALAITKNENAHSVSVIKMCVKLRKFCFFSQYGSDEYIFQLFMRLFVFDVPLVWSAAAERVTSCCTCSHWCGSHRESGSADTKRDVTPTHINIR